MTRLRKQKKRLQRTLNKWKKLKRVAPTKEKQDFSKAIEMLYILTLTQSKAKRKRFVKEVRTK